MVTKWDLADNSVTINRIGHPLTKNSRGTCALGTPMCISFVLTGQFPIPGVPSIAAPSAVFQSDMSPLAQNEKPEDPPMLLSIEARSPEGKLVTEVPEDGYVTLVGLTKGHKEGDEVTFSLKDGRTYNGYVEADNKAYARNCYLGEPKDDQDNGNGSNDSDTKEEESKGNNASSSESESNEKALAANSDSEKETKKEEFRKNGVSEALINDDAALENLKLEKFRRDSWEKQANWLDSAKDEDFDPYDKKTFLELYKKSNKGIEGECLEGYGTEKYKTLTDEEFQNILQIRYRLYQKNEMDTNTVFQKVVKCGGPEDIQAWVDQQNVYAKDAFNGGKNMQITGSTLVAADGQHLRTPFQLYDGLQLNYVGSDFQNCDTVYAVRYTASNPDVAKIPVHAKSEVPKAIDDSFVEMDKNKYPFTGNGFTPGVFGNLGTPEVQAKYPDGHIVNDGVIVKIDKNGNETIVGYVAEDENGLKQWVLKEDNSDPNNNV